MARSFLTTINMISKEINRASRAAVRERNRQERLQAQAKRAAERMSWASEKEAKLLYIESRKESVEEENEQLESEIEELSTLLTSVIGKDTIINFDEFIKEPELPTLDLVGQESFPLPPRIENYSLSPYLRFFSWLPLIKGIYEKSMRKAQQELTAAIQKHEADVALQHQKNDTKRAEHKKICQNIIDEVEKHNIKIKKSKAEFESGNASAVSDYFAAVMCNSKYSDGFLQEATRVIYIKESKQLLVEYTLPLLEDIIPTLKSYKYVKVNDKIVETLMPERQRKELYSSVIAQVILRCVHELFKADYNQHVETVLINGFIKAIDKSTGQSVRPCIITLRTTRDEFDAIDLRHVDPTACLQKLKASVSKDPSGLLPVRPILDLNMVDPRFIEESDILSALDQRPNLMDLSPSEFESLITNLFQKMGLDTKLTHASRDGGVDCVAYDPRPIFGGKVIIQAKRYKDKVGVSAVRDLSGTMQHEGASKGILITTSGYGKASYEFAKGKPIELLDGSNLLFLLNEHAGIDAKIIIPTT